MRNPEIILNNLIANSKKSEYRFQRLYRNLFNEEFFLIAYGKLAPNSGNLTEGISKETIDGFKLEYNRSVPAALKNALDVGSRPMGSSVWGGKPGLVVTVSPGGPGGFGANHALRQSLVFLDVPTLQQPEAYIGGIMNLVDNDGHIADGTVEFFKTITDKYIEFFNKLVK